MTYIHEWEWTCRTDDSLKVGDAEALDNILLAFVFSPSFELPRDPMLTYVSYDEDQSHETVQHNSEQDHARYTFACVVGLFRQMHGRIGTRKRAGCGDRTDKARSSNG